ncbi:MAG TPA: hypothetical protein VJJ23_00945 [Candidatus Nanoarchaeia archaeon]|nr:hypothetical protein [Candidatus Nanoarchaeia archaeon]
MGILDKLKRKKHEEELPDINQDFSDNSFTKQDFSQRQPIVPFQDFQQENNSSNQQLLLSKLDLILAKLQNLEHRIAIIEKIAKESQEEEQPQEKIIRRW